LRDNKNKYSNSCVVRKKISERNKKPYPPLQVKWSVPNNIYISKQYLFPFLKITTFLIALKSSIFLFNSAFDIDNSNKGSIPKHR
jgi:hypothetical protein